MELEDKNGALNTKNEELTQQMLKAYVDESESTNILLRQLSKVSS